jgi:hypothetical protein
MGHTDTLAPGTPVRCDYRDGHRGIVLARNDARAWANTLAFPTDSPDPDAVSVHVACCTFGDDKHPVLYPFGVRWDSSLHRVAEAAVTVGDKLIATAPGECFETGRVYTVLAVYDGKMDLECAALDTTVAGVQIDESDLQPYRGAR